MMLTACGCGRPHLHQPRALTVEAKATSILGPNTAPRMVAYTSAREPEIRAWAREILSRLGAELTAADVAAITEAGVLTPDVAARTEAALANLIDRIEPRWSDTMRASVAGASRDIRELLTPDAIREWMGRRGEQVLSGFSSAQSRAVAALIQHHATIEPLSQATLARLLRPVLGLTEAQTVSLLKRRAEMQAEGVVGDTLTSRLDREAGRMIRQRSALIARTELATAWNGGAQVTMERAEDSGAFASPLRKTWRAQPGKPCPICAGLNGRSVALRADFDGAYQTPPAHPSCRCVVLYQEAT